jgi:hypothetical protein
MSSRRWPAPVRRLLATLIVLVASSPPDSAWSQKPIDRLEFPLLEAPYNVKNGARFPGMQQSLAITTDFYELAHAALGRIAPRHPNWTKAGIVVADYLLSAVPLGDAWLHEEWHRAILGNRGIDSRNDVWNLRNVFSEAISVSHVRDEDLARLKTDQPADFIRLKAAGIEGELALVSRLEREQFFRQTRGWHVGLYWIIALNTRSYVGFVVDADDSTDVDTYTNTANRDETTVPKRDISGHDFTAWVYDLFRPTEAFAMRGTHPSGAGIDRYIKVADLTDEEKRFLRREGQLAWLNFVDPNLIGVRGFTISNPLTGSPLRANAWLRHFLTSFGHTIDANVVLQDTDFRLRLEGHRYTNHDRSFPGLSAEIVDWPLHVAGRRVELSPRAAVWSQPKGQAFRTRDGEPGGSVGVRVSAPATTRWHAYVDAEVKSAGWVAGRPELANGTTVRVGATLVAW